MDVVPLSATEQSLETSTSKRCRGARSQPHTPKDVFVLAVAHHQVDSRGRCGIRFLNGPGDTAQTVCLRPARITLLQSHSAEGLASRGCSTCRCQHSVLCMIVCSAGRLIGRPRGGKPGDPGLEQREALYISTFIFNEGAAEPWVQFELVFLHGAGVGPWHTAGGQLPEIPGRISAEAHCLIGGFAEGVPCFAGRIAGSEWLELTDKGPRLAFGDSRTGLLSNHVALDRLLGPSLTADLG